MHKWVRLVEFSRTQSTFQIVFPNPRASFITICKFQVAMIVPGSVSQEFSKGFTSTIYQAVWTRRPQTPYTDLGVWDSPKLLPYCLLPVCLDQPAPDSLGWLKVFFVPPIYHQVRCVNLGGVRPHQALHSATPTEVQCVLVLYLYPEKPQSIMG